MGLMIAAHARSRGCTLVSNDTRHAERVRGLLTADWAWAVMYSMVCEGKLGGILAAQPCGDGTEADVGLTIKNDETERLAEQVAEMAGESKTQAIRQSLRERRDRLALRVTPEARRRHLRRFLEREVWAAIPAEQLGKAPDRAERERILGYWPQGV